ncbi:porin family protein [Marivirga tractuosa]|uniref:porin family protein n=1 Tax=Marivirga tractuosa TaxID=1006 RepID=UPI0035D05FB5
MQANKNLLLLFFFFAISFSGIAQSSCVQNLRDARNAYDEGKLKELPELLLGCIENGFSKEEKVEALRLVTLSYLFNEEQEKAENSYLRLLKIDPEFEANEESDPTELLILADKFDTDPKFSYGVKASQNINFIDLESSEIVLSTAMPGGYEASLNISFGLFFQYPFNNKLAMNIELHYVGRFTSLERDIVNESNEDLKQIINETQQTFEIPLLLNYKLPTRKFPLELTGGTNVHLLQSASLTLEGAGINRNGQNILPYRNRVNMSAVLGLRSEFKIIGRNYLSAEILYQHRLRTEVKLPSQMDQLQLDMQLQNAHREFYYRGHAVVIRVGIRFPYFKPELIK